MLYKGFVFAGCSLLVEKPIASTVDPVMSSHSYVQPTSYGHFGILYTNEPLYNILAFKFKLSLFCNYVMFIFMYVSIIMSTLCIYDFF